MKVKLFTHTDLDGCGCAVVAKNAFEDVSVEYCDYTEINKKILDFLENDKPTDYDCIFITDISVNEEVAERLDLIHRGGVSKVQLVDHHATALWLAEKYPMWCEVRVEESNMYNVKDSKILFSNNNRDKVLSSGTSLFYKFLRNKNIPHIESNAKLKAFAEIVRQYDSWEWHNVYKNNHPKQLNDLLYIVGREKFVERFSDSPFPTFNDTELTLLEIEQHRINKYIWYKKKDITVTSLNIDNKTYRVAYVFAEQHSSLLGNAIAEDNPSVDFVVIIDAGSNKVSLRGIHEDINLGADVAKHFGGGGHAKASGFEFSVNLTDALFLKIFGGSL